jgi:ATP-dependent protease ClpP protease subunit
MYLFQATHPGGTLINRRSWRSLCAVLALTFAGHAQAQAGVQHTHQAYAKGNIDLYVTTGQCVLVIDGLVDDSIIKPLNEGLKQVQRLRCPERFMVLNSAGGAPRFAYSIADFIAKHEFDTEIAGGGICFSACAYVFLGGRKRVIAERGKFGVHQHSREGVCALGFSEVEERRMRTIMEKSLPAPATNRLIGLILGTDCNTMNFLTREDLEGMSITNTPVSRVNPEIRQAMATREAQVFEQFRTAARGTWTRAAGDRVLTVFTRESTETVAGSNPTVWGRVSYAADKAEQVSGEAYRTHEMLSEVDCDKQVIAVVRSVYTREPLGEGAVVWKTGRLSGVTVRPKTPAEFFYKLACGRPLSG